MQAARRLEAEAAATKRGPAAGHLTPTLSGTHQAPTGKTSCPELPPAAVPVGAALGCIESSVALDTAADGVAPPPRTGPDVEAGPAPAQATGLTIDPWAIPTSSQFVWPPDFSVPLDSSAFSFGSPSTVDFGALAGFLTEHSPGTDQRLISALENQTAYLSGDPGADDEVELYYYRFSGSTAIRPGINRISLKLQRRPGASAAAPEPEADEDDESGAQLNCDRDHRGHMAPPLPITGPEPSSLFDPSGLPLRSVFDPLFDQFLGSVGPHFPSVSRKRMTERYETGTMSAFLANCICAIGARFGSCNRPGERLAACAPFFAKAQELIVPLFHLPANDVATGLLLLAWASYGQNSESGLWQYTGMAVRMAVDLGLHENSEIYESTAHLVRTRNFFWTIFVTDRILAFATGRPTSINEDIIEIPLPEDADFFPDPARDLPGGPEYHPDEPVQPVPFVYLVRLMIVCGRISNVLNGRRGRARTLVTADEPLAEQLAHLQTRLVTFYASLPEPMRWSAANFKHQHARGHSSTFLTLHLWANAVLALVYHPDLLRSPSGVDTPLSLSMPRNVKLALASSRLICECMVFADLVSPTIYTASPFIVQPLHVAAMAIVHEMRVAQAAETGGSASDLFLVSMAKQNFTALQSAIIRIEGYWAGANYVTNSLERRSGISPKRSKIARRTFISLPDRGILQRFTSDRDHPHNIAPATETSLRASIARSQSTSNGPIDSIDLALLVEMSNTESVSDTTA